MLLYPVTIVIASWLNVDDAATIIGNIAPTYFVAISALVAAFFGANAYSSSKKSEAAVPPPPMQPMALRSQAPKSEPAPSAPTPPAPPSVEDYSEPEAPIVSEERPTPKRKIT
jgi:hypothetical protein